MKDDKVVCWNCDNEIEIDKYEHNKNNEKYKDYWCNNCGNWIIDNDAFEQVVKEEFSLSYKNVEDCIDDLISEDEKSNPFASPTCLMDMKIRILKKLENLL